ncbi:MAG: hypothetical protein COW48_02095 [Hydrogenophilales bacterium CG17_big_fil_post_rev_8_21_14_2_50_63_12]|nr:MAG: hypothetical protein COW48_02095 [Hydrogenophilales bacterium CG17_big_fil_post_rev_8_21_14_2_50_63_12]PIX98107.1 MAG: hypothetical protein COZ24_01735 [Hydrogenophilales bacterium CG_4_10_14_3_um_filter_63_21]PJB02565.1 MAG: hypothetical protein CO126_11330 [Hydrogenophilales bacterium CG_4_9_14_3_um_filter_63_34]
MTRTPVQATRLLTLAALLVLLATYFAPIWWVSLTAPNYPPEAFPDGIRIHFHFNGVFNGCKGAVIKKNEIYQGDLGDERETEMRGQSTQQQQLDCVHEMNTINHYVGMYPIDAGAPVERGLSRYFFGFFAAMLAAFAFPTRKTQIMVLAAGFLATAAWMGGEMLVAGRMNELLEHYRTAAGAYFNEPAVIARWTDNLELALKLTMGGLVAAMLVVLAGVWVSRPFSLLLALVPALLPVFFLIDYAGWLWFFGHNLHPWGAFTVKAFMPTVFGEGKVAQFSTYSYPYIGYGMLLLVTGLLLPAILLRRKAMREEAGGV